MIDCNLKENRDSEFCRVRNLYPVILVKPELGRLRIVNKKSTTSFKLESHETKAELDEELKDTVHKEWTPEHEVEMAVGSGFHRIHESDEERWALWDAGLEGQKYGSV